VPEKVRWLTAFVDRPAADVPAAVDFWTRVTGTTLSPVRGERGQFATFLPPEGDAFLRVQAVLAGPGGGHLDVHVGQPFAAAGRAVALGASAAPQDGYVTLRSPAGLPWCLVPDHGGAPGGAPRRPPPVRRPEGVGSAVDQVCLDVPPAAFEAECRFWQALTGWAVWRRPAPGFVRLARPDHLALGLLLQRLDEAPTSGVAACHLDLATTDLEREVARHEAWGARTVARREGWTTLTDPGGVAYCVTRRRP